MELTLSSINSAPVFILPSCDTLNGIEKVYFKTSKGVNEEIVEVTVVFRDEDQPFFLFDGMYDVYRRIRFHRKKDIETFFIHTGGTKEGLHCIDFGDTYSRNQHFHKGIVVHYREVVTREHLEMKGERPVIYINTWNHLFSEKDTNPALPKMCYTHYAVFNGSRSDSEPRL
jgi:hypothetical protein